MLIRFSLQIMYMHVENVKYDATRLNGVQSEMKADIFASLCSSEVV
jgi:hypothetical protein